MVHKAYVVLAEYPSSSSNKMHQVRRGGDGVLYCVCLGWAHSKSSPKMCKHTKQYVAANPGTSYGPQYGAPPMAARQAAKVASFGRRMQEGGISPSTPAVSAVSAAPANWRAVLLAEREAAMARVEQVPDALAAYSRDLDL